MNPQLILFTILATTYAGDLYNHPNTVENYSKTAEIYQSGLEHQYLGHAGGSAGGPFSQGRLIGQGGQFSQGDLIGQRSHIGQEGLIGQGGHFSQGSLIGQRGHFSQGGLIGQGGHHGQGGFAVGGRPEETGARVLTHQYEKDGHGYQYTYETENGIKAQETGNYQGKSLAVQGAYSYTGDDGQIYTVSYIADETGFHPSGAHIPIPPPAPDAIAKDLEQSAKAEATGIYDDGSYKEETLQSQSLPEQNYQQDHNNYQQTPQHTEAYPQQTTGYQDQGFQGHQGQQDLEGYQQGVQNPGW